MNKKNNMQFYFDAPAIINYQNDNDNNINNNNNNNNNNINNKCRSE